MTTKPNTEILNAMSKNPNNWRGVFYFNRKDPRLIVPKLHPALGWTLNFASWYTYLLLIAVFIIIAAVTYF